MNHTYEPAQPVFTHSNLGDEGFGQTYTLAGLTWCTTCCRWFNLNDPKPCTGSASKLPPDREQKMWDYIRRIRTWDPRCDEFLEF
jgi:hypothetical protein